MISKTDIKNRLIFCIILAVFFVLYLPTVIEFVFYGTPTSNILVPFSVLPVYASYIILSRCGMNSDTGTVGFISFSIGLYLAYVYGVSVILSAFARMLANRYGVSRKTLIVCTVTVLVIILSSALIVGRNFDRNPNMREMVLDSLRPGMHVSEVRKLVPRKLFRHAPMLIKFDDSDKAIYAQIPWFNTNNTHFVSSQAESSYVMRLFADGTQKQYHSELFFDSDKRLVGIHFRLGFEKRPDGLLPQALPDHSKNWKPKWEESGDVELPK